MVETTDTDTYKQRDLHADRDPDSLIGKQTGR